MKSLTELHRKKGSNQTNEQSWQSYLLQQKRSFYKVIEPKAVAELTDYDIGYARTEIRCSRCGAHLGHMFQDGPPPTGLRYCMNGVAMEFVKEPSP